MHKSVMAHLHDAPVSAHPTQPNTDDEPYTQITLTFGETSDNVHVFIPLERVDEVCAALVAAHAEAHNTVPALG